MENFVKHEVPGLTGTHREGSAIEQFAGAAEYWHQEALRWKSRAAWSFSRAIALGAVGGAMGSLAIWWICR